MADEITYESGAIYADDEGCLYSTFVYPNGDVVFFAFGSGHMFAQDELTENDEPKTLVFDNEGNVHVDKLNYLGGTNTR